MAAPGLGRLLLVGPQPAALHQVDHERDGAEVERAGTCPGGRRTRGAGPRPSSGGGAAVLRAVNASGRNARAWPRRTRRRAARRGPGPRGARARPLSRGRRSGARRTRRPGRRGTAWWSRRAVRSPPTRRRPTMKAAWADSVPAGDGDGRVPVLGEGEVGVVGPTRPRLRPVTVGHPARHRPLREPSSATTTCWSARRTSPRAVAAAAGVYRASQPTPATGPRAVLRTYRGATVMSAATPIPARGRDGPSVHEHPRRRRARRGAGGQGPPLQRWLRNATASSPARVPASGRDLTLALQPAQEPCERTWPPATTAGAPDPGRRGGPRRRARPSSPSPP